MAVSASDFIVAWLKNEPAVTSVVGSGVDARIRPLSLSQGLTRPYIAYQETANQHRKHLKGRSAGGRSMIQLQLWDVGRQAHQRMHDLAAAIHGTKDFPKLDGFHGFLGGLWVEFCRLDDISDGGQAPADASDDFVYQVAMTFSVFYREIQSS